MEEKSYRRKSIVKNVAIVFLIVLLILTFFSNTIMNYSLPQVSAQYPTSGTITSKIKGTGTVSANQNYEVRIGETRKITEVLVRQGDSVEIGDVLFKLGDTESTELQTAKDALETLNYEYDALTKKLDPSYSELLIKISQAEKALAQKNELKNNIGVSSEKLTELKAEIKELEAEKKDLTSQINKLKKLINNDSTGGELIDTDMTGTSLEDRIAAALEARDNAQSEYDGILLKFSKQALAGEDIDDYIQRLTDYQTAASEALEKYKTEHPSTSTSEDKIVEQQQAISDMELALKRMQEDYSLSQANLQSQLNDAYSAYQKAYAEYAAATAETVDELYTAYKSAEKTYIAAVDALNSDQLKYDRDIEDQRIKITRAQEELAKLTEDYNQAEYQNLKTASENATADVKAATKLKTDIENAKTKLTEKKTAYETLTKLNANTDYNAQIDELTAKSDAIDETLTDKNAELKKLEDAGATDLDTINSQISDAKLTLVSLKNELYTSNIDIEKKQNEIDKKEAEIEKLEKASTGTTVTAPIAGTISAVNFSAGQDTSDAATLCTIFVADKGYMVSFSVTKEQASRVKVGDAAKVQYFWYGDCEATVSAIKSDSSNPQNRTIELNVTGDVSVGQSLTFTLGERGSSYDTIVPNSAVREDSNGKFILVVESKSTPLGTRYTAQRVDVQVLASDETQSALSSVLTGGEFVITTSTKPITAGTQVRLVEN